MAQVLSLFRFNDVRDFTVDGLSFDEDGYRMVFQEMRDLSRLRLERLDIWPVLDALSPDGWGTFMIVTETTLIRSPVCSWMATANPPQTEVINPVLPQHL